MDPLKRERVVMCINISEGSANIVNAQCKHGQNYFWPRKPTGTQRQYKQIGDPHNTCS